MKNSLSIFFVLAIGILIVVGCEEANENTSSQNTPQNSSTPTSQAPTEKPVDVTAKALTKDYEDNEIAADEKYRDKTLAVSGKISNIAETLGNLTVSLEGHNPVITVMCSFEEDQKSNVAKLKKGQNVTLIGKGDGSTGGLFVGLKGCKIK